MLLYNLVPFWINLLVMSLSQQFESNVKHDQVCGQMLLAGSDD